MTYVKIQEGVVVQKQPNAENGFVEAPNSVVCGMMLVEGEFVDPPAFSTLYQAITAKLADLDDYRWLVEVGGADFGGVTIRTDLNSQAKVMAAWAMANADPDYSIPIWEVAPGVFMPLSNADILAMAAAVRDHIQETFNRKAELYPQIQALETVEAIEGFDIAAEWDLLAT